VEHIVGTPSFSVTLGCLAHILNLSSLRKLVTEAGGAQRGIYSRLVSLAIGVPSYRWSDTVDEFTLAYKTVRGPSNTLLLVLAKKNLEKPYLFFAVH
jgi:hypothetical protein